MWRTWRDFRSAGNIDLDRDGDISKFTAMGVKPPLINSKSPTVRQSLRMKGGGWRVWMNGTDFFFSLVLTRKSMRWSNYVWFIRLKICKVRGWTFKFSSGNAAPEGVFFVKCHRKGGKPCWLNGKSPSAVGDTEEVWFLPRAYRDCYSILYFYSPSPASTSKWISTKENYLAAGLDFLKQLNGSCPSRCIIWDLK
jgi:hypothetical protein